MSGEPVKPSEPEIELRTGRRIAVRQIEAPDHQTFDGRFDVAAVRIIRITRQAAAACSGLEVQVESEHDRFPLARSLRRARVAAGTARGTNPTEPSRRPAAWPERPCAPLLACARTPPARSTPGWAHRFGSPVLPIKTPGLGHRSDSA